jgi:hypothetical protein
MHLQPVFASCEVVGGGVAEARFRDGLCLPSGDGAGRDGSGAGGGRDPGAAEIGSMAGPVRLTGWAKAGIMGCDGGTNQRVASQNTGQASTGGGDGMIINTSTKRRSQCEICVLNEGICHAIQDRSRTRARRALDC